jgi:hypothetical protein
MAKKTKKKFVPHTMFHPDTGEGVKVKTHKKHLDLSKKGWTHRKPSRKPQPKGKTASLRKRLVKKMGRGGGY